MKVKPLVSIILTSIVLNLSSGCVSSLINKDYYLAPYEREEKERKQEKEKIRAESLKHSESYENSVIYNFDRQLVNGNYKNK
ncbi:MAG: hypothetical protein WC438_04685 [Candidatus Pacearchaeota archaeon]